MYMYTSDKKWNIHKNYVMLVIDNKFTDVFTVFEIVILQCPTGYYADTTGKATCTICPAGSSCSDPTVAPVACPSGQVGQYIVQY